MMRIACIIAARITGSPLWRMRPPTKEAGPFFAVSGAPMTRPVSIRPQVEALTSQESDWPWWAPQLPERIFSAIRSSRVAASGTRSSASARHIRARPSELVRPNSSRKLSIIPLRRPRPRAICTSSRPRRTAPSRIGPGSTPCLIRPSRRASSSANFRASSASQSTGSEARVSGMVAGELTEKEAKFCACGAGMEPEYLCPELAASGI